MGFFQIFFNFSPLGNVFNGQKNDLFCVKTSINLPGIEEHGSFPDIIKFPLNFEIFQGYFFMQNIFQKFPEYGNIPLIISQIIDEVSFGFFDLGFKHFIVGAADSNHS